MLVIAPLGETMQFQLRLDDGRTVLADPKARYFGAALEHDTLVPLGAAPRLGRVRYADWLAAQGAD